MCHIFFKQIHKPRGEFYLNYMHDVQFCLKKYASVQCEDLADSPFYGIR